MNSFRCSPLEKCHVTMLEPDFVTSLRDINKPTTKDSSETFKF